MFDVFLLAIQEFCKANNLDYEKVKTSPRCGNNNVCSFNERTMQAPLPGYLMNLPLKYF